MQQLVICAIGQNKPDLLKTLSKTILESGGNIMDSHVTILGEQFTMVMLLTGSWDTIVKIEDSLPRLQSQLALTFTSKRTEFPQKRTHLLPYTVEIIALYHPAIIYEVAQFFADNNVHVEDLIAHRYTVAQTETQMFSLTLGIYIPANIPIANLRGEFMDLCDELNLDSVMIPTK